MPMLKINSMCSLFMFSYQCKVLMDFFSISSLLNATKWTQSFLHFMKSCSSDPVGPPANCNIEKAIQGFPGVCELPCSVLSVSGHNFFFWIWKNFFWIENIQTIFPLINLFTVPFRFVKANHYQWFLIK